MLKANADRVWTFFAADFEPLVGFEAKLAGAAEAMQSRLKAPHWGYAPGRYVLRDTVQRLLAIVDFRRVFFQSLGLGVWQKNLDEYAEVIKVGLQKLGVQQLKRIGFQATANLAIGMSHKEMAELMFGSYIRPARELQDVASNFDDVLLQLYGEEKGIKFQLTVAPMTQEQAVATFMATGNLEVFLEPKLVDAGVKEFKDRIATDCFHVSLDLSRSDVAQAEIPIFLRQSLDLADTMSAAAIQKLKSLRVKKG